MSYNDIVEKIRKKYERLSGVLDERSRRVWASAEAEALGYGGQSIVAKATGLSQMTFYSQNLDGSNENNSAPPHPSSAHTERRWRMQEVDTARIEVAIGAGSISGTNDSW